MQSAECEFEMKCATRKSQTAIRNPQSAIEYQLIAATGVNEFSRRAAPDRDIPEPGAHRIGEQIVPISRLCEISVESPDLAPPDMYLCWRGYPIGTQLGLGEISDAVAEAVNVDNATFDQAPRFDQSRTRDLKS